MTMDSVKLGPRKRFRLAPMSITVEVTQADIDAAIRQRDTDEYNSVRDCPLAQAMWRTFPKADYIVVDVINGKPHIRLLLHGVGTEYFGGNDAFDFMRAFDRYFEVTPQTFTFTERV